MREYIITCDEETAAWIGNDVDFMKPIVRCRDCVHYDPHCTDDGVCFLPDGDGDFARWEVKPDGFCAWASRKVDA